MSHFFKKILYYL